MKSKYIFFYCLLMLSLNSCVNGRKINFTQDIRNRLEAKNIDLAKLQYYIDGDVILSREISSDTAKILKGEVVFQNGKYYETITLRKNTQGICTAIYPNRLNVSFETDNNKFLVFSVPDGDIYQLVNNDISVLNPNVMTYDCLKYSISLKTSIPYLLIKKSVVTKEISDARTMKGRKIN